MHFNIILCNVDNEISDVIFIRELLWVLECGAATTSYEHTVETGTTTGRLAYARWWGQGFRIGRFGTLGDSVSKCLRTTAPATNQQKPSTTTAPTRPQTPKTKSSKFELF